MNTIFSHMKSNSLFILFESALFYENEHILVVDLLTVVNVACGWHMFRGETMLQICQYEIRFANLFIANNNTLDCIARLLPTLFYRFRCFYGSSR